MEPIQILLEAFVCYSILGTLIIPIMTDDAIWFVFSEQKENREQNTE